MAGSFRDLLEELFAPVGGVTLKRMFGGVGVFRDGMMFGLVDDDVLYLKADDASSARYVAEGQERWVYEGRGKQIALPYWRLPERLYDEPDEFREWAMIAFAVTERNRQAKAKSKSRKEPRPKVVVEKSRSAKPKPKKKTAPKRR